MTAWHERRITNVVAPWSKSRLGIDAGESVGDLATGTRRRHWPTRSSDERDSPGCRRTPDFVNPTSPPTSDSGSRAKACTRAEPLSVRASATDDVPAWKSAAPPVLE